MAEIKDTNNQLDETQNAENQNSKGYNFVEQLVYDDLKAGKNGGRLNTRFPPEPNGYLHIGHAKAICMDFGVAEKFGGTCNLRFDDTNPVKEDVEYVDSIREDIKWLGFDWGDREYYASDYFRGHGSACWTTPCRFWRGALVRPPQIRRRSCA